MNEQHAPSPHDLKAMNKAMTQTSNQKFNYFLKRIAMQIVKEEEERKEGLNK